MNVGIVIQARMGSKRLPGKVLKPLSNIPIVKHVFDRASTSKMASAVWVVTSVCEENDVLCAYLSEWSIPYYRGSEQDVLSRYLKIADQENFDIIVRLTSDNPLVAHEDIDCLIRHLIDNSYDYVTQANPAYGTNVEVFNYKVLREAYENNIFETQDLEHVTRYLLRHADQFNIGYLENVVDASHMRVTVDTREDYDMMATVYRQLYRGYPIPTQQALEYIEHKFYKLVLGGAQLGFKYGINNQEAYQMQTALDILRTYDELSLQMIDTASAYGESEINIGAYYRSADIEPIVISKYIPDESTMLPDIKKQLMTSLKNMNLKKMPFYFLHHFEDYEKDPQVFEKLLKLKQEGLISLIGISLYHPEELETLIKDNILEVVDAIQIPINIIDTRWHKYEAILKEKHIIVFARSIFLQGLLLSQNTFSGLSIDNEVALIKKDLDALALQFKYSRYQLVLNYVFHCNLVDYVVVGFDAPEQLIMLKEQLRANYPLEEVQKEVKKLFNSVTEEILNPSLWKKI